VVRHRPCVDRQGARGLGNEIDAAIRVEPFELNPDMGPEGAEVVPYLTKKYGRTPEQIAEAQARIRAARRRRRVHLRPARPRVEHVRRAPDASLGAAGREGRELKRALLRAYHGEGRNPASPTC
jgi:predicted DsbA family dithiol-disulfide isomerase